jgi:hypothetical protein
MKSLRIAAFALFALIVAISFAFAFTGVLAQTRPEGKKQDGHNSPVSIKITYGNGKTRTGLLLGIGASASNEYFTHTIKTIGPNDEKASSWIDALKSITDITKDKALFTYKDESLKGQSRRRMSWSDVNGNLNDSVVFRYTMLYVSRPDGGTDRIDMTSLESVEFLKAARTDKDGYAMFDHWTYSPYTGEKLPKVIPDSADKEE